MADITNHQTFDVVWDQVLLSSETIFIWMDLTFADDDSSSQEWCQKVYQETAVIWTFDYSLELIGIGLILSSDKTH